MFRMLILYLIYFLWNWKMGSLEENLPGPIKGKHKKKEGSNEEEEEANKSDKKSQHHHHPRGVHKNNASHHKHSGCSGDASSSTFFYGQQFTFNPSKYVWSNGLYCSFEEDLNLESWTHFECCKTIWEKVRDPGNSRLGRSMKTKFGWKRRAATMVSKATDTSELDLEVLHTELPPPIETIPSKACRNVASSPSPACALVVDDSLSDISLSLEPISSSSLHSSSDLEEDT